VFDSIYGTAFAIGQLGQHGVKANASACPFGSHRLDQFICRVTALHWCIVHGCINDILCVAMSITPTHLDLDRAKGLHIEWSDGRSSFYPVPHLRRWSPSADARDLRSTLKRDPLAVLPSSSVSQGALRAQDMELIGNYAVRIVFSDGHRTGLYSWDWLRQIDPAIQGGDSPDNA
jgi:DUF971 family protein